MDDMLKINKKGRITIPKAVREKYGWAPGIPLVITESEGGITVRPAIVCWRCKKVLFEKFEGNNVCPNCPPPSIIKVY